MSETTTPESAPAEAPVETPETAEETAEANAASDPPAEGAEAPAEAPAEPDKPSLAAEVMRRRDASQLAALVREKKELERTAAKYKEHEAKLAAMERIERHLEDGDDAAAVEELLKLKVGDGYKERLASTYNVLTEYMLGGQDRPKQSTKVERGLSRIEKDLEALKQEKADLAARLAAKEAEERERAIQGAKQTVEGYLKDVEHEYPFLLAEADEPAEIVWSILEAAQERGDELTLAQAASLANDHFQPIYERKKPRYLNLPATNKASGDQAKPETPPSPKSASPRKSITNADASQAAAEKPLPPPRTEQERLDRSFAVLQRSLTKS